MKLGTEFPEKWKEKSQRDDIALADILYGYAVEDIMQRLCKSSFYEYFWLSNEEVIGENAYKKKNKSRLEFFYVEKEKKSFHIETVAGDSFGKAILTLFEKEVLGDADTSDISWNYEVKEHPKGASISLVGMWMDKQVPISIWIDAIQLPNKKEKEKNRLLFMNEKKSFSYYAYGKESILAEDLFEIMRKLELISDMGCYDRVNEILKIYSISGRYIIEDFKDMGQKEPKVVTIKRLQQVLEYKNYGYMKKKWQQYAKQHRKDYDEWEQVMKRLENFLAPIWTALCEDEIFFDDWMPELERFLS